MGEEDGDGTATTKETGVEAGAATESATTKGDISKTSEDLRQGGKVDNDGGGGRNYDSGGAKAPPQERT